MVTGPGGGLLRAARAVIEDVDSALLCVAFADVRGVQLLRKEIEAASQRKGARLLVTTVCGSTSEEALTLATRLGANVRVLNPGSGRTYHPKVYLGRRADHAAALVGSVNLTSGLAVNIEAASHLMGRSSDRPIRELWDWAEALWSDPRVAEWQPAPGSSSEESIDPELLRLIQAAAREQPRFYTLGPSPRLNYVAEVTPAGLYVETKRSRQRTGGAEVIEPWMLNLAWEVLRSRGELTNQTLLHERTSCASIDRARCAHSWRGSPASRRSGAAGYGCGGRGSEGLHSLACLAPSGPGLAFVLPPPAGTREFQGGPDARHCLALELNTLYTDYIWVQMLIHRLWSRTTWYSFQCLAAIIRLLSGRWPRQ